MKSHSLKRQRRFSRRSRRRYIEPGIESEVRQKALVENWTATEIHRLLLDEARHGKWEDADVPSLRTVQRVLKDIRIEQHDGPWSLKDDLGDETKVVLDVLRWLIVSTRGRKRTLTKGEAVCIAELHRVTPNADELLLWILCQQYMLHRAKGLDTRALDSYIVFTPWVNALSFTRYCELIVRKWIDPAPLDIIAPIVPPRLRGCLLDTTFQRIVRGTMTLDEWRSIRRNPPEQLRVATVAKLAEPHVDDKAAANAIEDPLSGETIFAGPDGELPIVFDQILGPIYRDEWEAYKGLLDACTTATTDKLSS
jgi:hypothetical protein